MIHAAAAANFLRFQLMRSYTTDDPLPVWVAPFYLKRTKISPMSEEAELEEDEGSGRRRGIKTLRDVQKVQLEKLMANPVKHL